MKYIYRAKIARVVDADTIVFDIDLGYHITTRQTIRLAYINAPERNTPQHAAALKAINAYFATDMLTGYPCVIDSLKYDPYGRSVAVVWAQPFAENLDLRESFNLYLIKTGNAIWYDAPDKIKMLAVS